MKSEAYDTSTTDAGGPPALRHGAQDIVKRDAMIVSLPEIYLRARQTLDDPSAGLAELAEVMSNDPGMTARLLKLANSAMYGFVAEIQTVTQAVTLLGAAQIEELVLLTSVCRAFRGISNKHVNMDLYWQKSVHCAALSRSLGQRCSALSEDGLFVAGLLHDIGHLPMYDAVPELCEQALLSVDRCHRPLHELERELIGCDYAEVGGELLSMWQLPKPLVHAVMQHVEPLSAEEFQQQSALVHTAAVISTAASVETPLAERKLGIDHDVLDLIGLDQADCAEACFKADELSRETLQLIFPGHG